MGSRNQTSLDALCVLHLLLHHVFLSGKIQCFQAKQKNVLDLLPCEKNKKEKKQKERKEQILFGCSKFEGETQTTKITRKTHGTKRGRNPLGNWVAGLHMLVALCGGRFWANYRSRTPPKWHFWFSFHVSFTPPSSPFKGALVPSQDVKTKEQTRQHETD